MTTRPVILVDDDDAALAAMRMMLETWGLNVAAALTYHEGRALLTENPRAAALVTDIRLGTFNGLQLVYVAKQANPDLCAILVSGFDDPVLQAEAASMGVPLLLKPVDVDDLRRRLASVFECADDDGGATRRR